jgi:hypothetical protein
MGGNSAAPHGHPINLGIRSTVAAKLAFYYGQGLFVLAPRGWECISMQGADGSYLLVTPPGRHDRFGATIYIENWPNQPNGWAMIAAYGGTYFPKIITTKDVNSAITQLNQKGGSSTKVQFLAPKYPNDRITYLSDSVLKYETPSEKLGLGIEIGSGLPSDSHMNPDFSRSLSNLPTYGVVGLLGVTAIHTEPRRSRMTSSPVSLR